MLHCVFIATAGNHADMLAGKPSLRSPCCVLLQARKDADCDAHYLGASSDCTSIALSLYALGDSRGVLTWHVVT